MSEAVNTKADEEIVNGHVTVSWQNFTWQNYTVFFCVLLITASVGFYFGFSKSAFCTQGYLFGRRKIKTVPTALSLVASFSNGMILFKIATETYIYGIQYIYTIFGILLMALVFEKNFLPVFYELNTTSLYEYLELRFGKWTRFLVSMLFTIETVICLSIIVCVPASAFNQVTGVNVDYITPIACIICIIYTCIGGIKVVVWTNVIQLITVIGAVILIVSKGTADVGGYGVVWSRNLESERIEEPILNLNPSSRHTFWSLLIGGFLSWLQIGAVNQIMMQRYISLPDVTSARWALWLFITGIIFIYCLGSYAGLVIYATYYKCDPLTTNRVEKPIQLFPLLTMNVLGNVPGLPGLFAAGIFSATLSIFSAGLNSMAAVVLEDFYKSYVNKALEEYGAQILMRMTVIILGAVCLAIVFIMERFDVILQLFTSISIVSSGASLAIFCMGVLLPWITEIGAIIGGLFSLCIVTCLHLMAPAHFYFPRKKVSVESCDYPFTPPTVSIYVEQHPDNNTTVIVNQITETFTLYGHFRPWYTSLGTLIAITVGLLVSFTFKHNDPRDVNPALLAPCIRNLIKPREFPNQPAGNEIIYAYERETRGLTTFPKAEVTSLDSAL